MSADQRPSSQWPEACQGLHERTGWVEVTCEKRDEFMRDYREMIRVFSSLTDPDGQYGPGVVFTEWGVGDRPWLRDYRWKNAVCTHLMPAVAWPWVERDLEPTTKGSSREDVGQERPAEASTTRTPTRCIQPDPAPPTSAPTDD